MKKSIVELTRNEKDIVFGGGVAKDAAILVANVVAPFVGLGIGIGIFLILTKEKI